MGRAGQYVMNHEAVLCVYVVWLMVLMEVQFWHEELDTTLQGLIASKVFFVVVLVPIQPDFAAVSFYASLAQSVVYKGACTIYCYRVLSIITDQAVTHSHQSCYCRLSTVFADCRLLISNLVHYCLLLSVVICCGSLYPLECCHLIFYVLCFMLVV